VFDNTTQVKLKTIFDKPLYQFCLTQLFFWLFICIISLFTLTLWYGPDDWSHINHMFFQAFIGLLLSLPLYWLLVKIWQYSIKVRIISSIASVLLVSFVWTILRMNAFMYMTDEKNIWADLGGWYFGSIFIFLCWIGLFYLTMYYKLLQFEHSAAVNAEAEAQKEQLKRIKAQSVAKDAQMKMLRYQLNPHFLYNTLNAVNALIEAEEHEKAQQVTIKLSKFLRHSLEGTPDTSTTLAKEIIMLNLFLDIEKTRFGERLEFSFLIADQANNAQIPSLLLQPIIENSMKHVIAKNEDGGKIKVSATVANERLIIELTDTGSAENIDINKLTSGNFTGVGLHNINNRLKLIFDDDYLFKMSLMPSGALKTIIDIPCQYQTNIS